MPTARRSIWRVIAEAIDYFLVVWFMLAAGSTAYVAWDQYRNNPEPTVMKWGFILVTLYMGPIGLLLYVLADKEPQEQLPEDRVAYARAVEKARAERSADRCAQRVLRRFVRAAQRG